MNKQLSAADSREGESTRPCQQRVRERESERHGMNGNEMWTAVGFVPSEVVWGGWKVEGEGFSKLVTYLRAFIVIWGSRRWAAFTDN